MTTTTIVVRNREWTPRDRYDVPWCPRCGAPEMHPDRDVVLIRGYKVDNDSQCLVCAGYYDDELNVPDQTAKPSGGWFNDEIGVLPGPDGEVGSCQSVYRNVCHTS
jgi:hypothetical protein